MQKRSINLCRAQILCLFVALSACGEKEAQGGDADPAAFQRLFEGGFDEMAAAAAGAAVAASTDHRLGIPYEPAGRVTRQVEQALAANLGENFTLRFARENPGEFLTEGKARELYRRELSARGLPADSVAGATALLFIVAWEQANTSELSRAQSQAILAQINTSLRGDALERAGDADRQTQAEVRLLTAALWLDEAYLRQPFPDQTRELSDAVQRDMQKISGNDMRAHTVTPGGFAKR